MGSVTNLKENKTLFVLCDCASEILMIEYDHTIGLADLAIYEHFRSFTHKISLWQRLRYCWKVLVDKKPYADQITLSKSRLLELKGFLSSLDLK